MRIFLSQIPTILAMLVALATPISADSNRLGPTLELLANPALLNLAPAPATSAVRTLISAYAPRIWFHPGEPYASSDPLDFLRHSSLWSYHRILPDGLLAATGQAQPASLSRLAPATFLRHQRPDPDRTPARERSGEPAPLLWRLGRETGTSDTVMIEYWYHSDQNIGIGAGIGDHQGDWESLAVLLQLSLSPEGELRHRPLAAYYSVHESGQWYCASELSWTDRSVAGGLRHPEAFSAWGSHATYPLAGRFRRFFFFADLTARGRPWDSWKRLRPLALEPYYGFNGAWGERRWFSWISGPRVPGPGSKLLPSNQADAGPLADWNMLRARCGF